jgi:para-nitrobenzyl esterase
MYYWKYPSAIPYMGACHAVELAYVFNNLNETIYTGDNIDTGLAAKVQQMWVNFAKTGDPSTDEYKWTPYDSTDRMTMLLGKRIGMNSDPLPQQRVLVEPLLKYHINGQYMAVDYSLMFLKKQLVKGLMILLAVNGSIAGAFALNKLIRKRKGRQIP